MTTPIVLKIGGHDIANPDFLTELAATIAGMSVPVAIVHGGAKEITAYQTRLGIEPRYVDGLRITDAETLALVEMVLCGLVNKRLVRYLLNAGVNAAGMSAVDRKLVRAKQMQHETEDMQFTGEIAEVNGDVLQDYFTHGITPVIAPVCYGETTNYNVNADHVAGAIGAAINAEKVTFITNVPGVMQDDTILETLTATDAEQLIETGVISGGMIPKVRTALGVLKQGVPRAGITNLAGLKTQGGTVFIA
ncbi:MAG: acetylglutamate kinase [Aggregatilineales bacterium]